MCAIIFPVVLGLSASLEPEEIIASKAALVEMDETLMHWTYPRSQADYHQYAFEDVMATEDYSHDYPAPSRFLYLAEENSGLRRNVTMRE